MKNQPPKENNMIEHTATPWKWHAQGDADEYCLLTDDKNGWVIAFRQNGEFMVDKQRANATFIVKACNAHDELVAALTAITDICEDDDKYPIHTEQARKALAKATGAT